MELHQTQKKVAKSKAPYRVVNCGRQWGKTTLGAWEMIGIAYAKKDARILYFATTIDQARDIAWAMLKQYAEPITVKTNESRLELTVLNKHNTTSQIKLAGYENVETQRGKQYDFIVADEVGKMSNFKYSWEAILEATLVYRKGTALFISTPRGYNHFHEMYQMGQNPAIPEWESWHFTSYDNPHLDSKWLNRRKDLLTAEFFSQEYLAEFTRFTGLIYKEFDSNTHVHYFDTNLDDPGEYLFGLDFAVRGFTGSILSRLNSDGHIYIIDEYKKEGGTAKLHARAIKDKLTKYATLDKWTGFADPAGWITTQQVDRSDKPMQWALAEEYLEEGLPITRGNNKVTPGINHVRQLFKVGKIHIHSRCVELVEELLQYQWKDQPTKRVGEVNEPEQPRKFNDHLMDSMRYMLFSKPVPPEPEVPYEPGMPLIFGAPKIDLPQDDTIEVVNENIFE